MKITLFTGPEITAESGLSPIRFQEGIWADRIIKEVATLEAFAENPELVYEFHNERRRELLQPHIQPNTAHYALARLAQSKQHEVNLITQNVDHLHELAGHSNVIYMQGELLKAYCAQCYEVYPWSGDLTTKHHCACNQPENDLRPMVSWYQQLPFMLQEINDSLMDCDLFVIIGVSVNTYPIRQFIQFVKNKADTKVVSIHLERINNPLIDEYYLGLLSEQVPKFINTLTTEFH